MKFHKRKDKYPQTKTIFFQFIHGSTCTIQVLCSLSDELGQRATNRRSPRRFLMVTNKKRAREKEKRGKTNTHLVLRPIYVHMFTHERTRTSIYMCDSSILFVFSCIQATRVAPTLRGSRFIPHRRDWLVFTVDRIYMVLSRVNSDCDVRWFEVAGLNKKKKRG